MTLLRLKASPQQQSRNQPVRNEGGTDKGRSFSHHTMNGEQLREPLHPGGHACVTPIMGLGNGGGTYLRVSAR
jgi:hypothetical protein